MSALRQQALGYLSLRRALGYKLIEVEKLLLQFIDHLQDTGKLVITTADAVAWAQQSGTATPKWSQRRLSVVRSFACYLVALEPATEVPAARLLRCFPNRTPPHLYSQADITALTEAAGQFRQPLRAATYQSIIGLLAITGLRIGEVVRFDRDDVDFDGGVLTILDSKFGKSRQVLLHPTTVTALRNYAQVRDQAIGTVGSPAFFVSTKGRLLVNTPDYTFADLVDAAAIHTAPGVRRPRLHDFRHSFAVSTLLHWYRAGVDVQSRLPLLSTWLGHVSPASTYWYLQAAPELLSLAADRLEHPLAGA